MRSSAEFTATRGTRILSSAGAGIVVARRLERIQDVVGVGRLQVTRRSGRGPHRRRRASAVLLSENRIAAHEYSICGAVRSLSAALVVAALPLGVGADRIDRDAAPHAVATGNLGRQTRQRHQRVHEVGVRSPHSHACMPPIDVPMTSRR